MPLIVLAVIIWFMPESPRWLIQVGSEEEAHFILERLRGADGPNGDLATAECRDIVRISDMEKEAAKQQSYIHMLFGIGSDKLHIDRRVQLVIWLQILQEWIGIAGITIYGPKIFEIAGISPENRLWVVDRLERYHIYGTLNRVLFAPCSLMWICPAHYLLFSSPP